MIYICPKCNRPVEAPRDAVHPFHETCYDAWLFQLCKAKGATA